MPWLAAPPAPSAELDSRAFADEAVADGGCAADAADAAGAAVAEVSRMDAVTPAASTAAPSRHTPPIACGECGRRSQLGRRPPPALFLSGSPVMSPPPVAVASLVSVALSGMTQRSRAPSLMGSSTSRQDSAAAATVPATTATARPGLTGLPAAPAPRVSTMTG